jgi:hypothetical protein
VTRPFAALILVSLTIFGCRSADTGLTGLIPGDTMALMGVRMDQLRATPLYQKLRAQGHFSELDDLRKRTGFDPTRDVSQMLIAFNGKDAVTIARGHFAPNDPGAKQASYKGYTLRLHGDGAYALIDASTAVAGTQAGVRAAIDQYKKGGRSANVAALLARSQALSPDNQIWAVSDSPDAFTGLGLTGSTAQNVGKVIGEIDRLTFTADFRNGLNAVASGDCRTDQDAKNLGDALRGLVSLGKMTVPQNQPDLLKLYDSVQVDQQQKVVKLVAKIPPNLMDKLLALVSSVPRPTRQR